MEGEANGLPLSRMAAVGALLNTLVWGLDLIVPEEHHGKPWYRRVKALLAPALGALIGLVPGLLSEGYWADRMIFGAMVGGSSTALHNGAKRRQPRAPKGAPVPEVAGP